MTNFGPRRRPPFRITNFKTRRDGRVYPAKPKSGVVMKLYYLVEVTHHYPDPATGEVQDYTVEYGVAESSMDAALKTAERAEADFPDSTVKIRTVPLEVNA